MDRTKTVCDYEIQKYVNKHSLRLTEHQLKMVDYSMKQERNVMLGSLDSAQHFQLILKAINAKKCLEVGCFTGSTTLTIALALPEDGKVITTDITDQYAAQDIWKEAGVDHKINLIVGPAVDSLNKLIETEAGTYDFVFIDADKPNYMTYYEQALKLLRKNGLVAIDNVLWSGRVLDENTTDEMTKIFQTLNTFIKEDPRVDISMLTVGDGVTFCLKK